VIAASPDPGAIVSALSADSDRLARVTGNALALARQQFLISDIRARFWGPIVELAHGAPGHALADGARVTPTRP